MARFMTFEDELGHYLRGTRVAEFPSIQDIEHHFSEANLESMLGEDVDWIRAHHVKRWVIENWRSCRDNDQLQRRLDDDLDARQERDDELQREAYEHHVGSGEAPF